MNREAVLALTVRGIGPQTVEVIAVIDTGFTEYLTLTGDALIHLSLPYVSEELVTMADGREVWVKV